MNSCFTHTSVLLQDSVDSLNIVPDGVYIDCTFGRGGHAQKILAKLGVNGRLIAFDKDLEAIACAQKIQDPRFTIVHADFSELKEYIVAQGLLGKIDGVLVDLGVSSPQIDNAERGFSFQNDGPLDMRMDTTNDLTAANWLQNATAAEIIHVLRHYGEERQAPKIARAIVQDREIKPFTRTKELADLIARLIGKHGKDKKHPATKTFQAIRIFINNELDSLTDMLDDVLDVLAAGGRLAVISFHSLEDRIVKQFIKKHSSLPDIPKEIPLTNAEILKFANIKLKVVKQRIKPSQDEISKNIRSRSSVLRVAERTS